MDKILFPNNVGVPSYAKIYYSVNTVLDGESSIIKKEGEVRFFMSEVDKNFINSKDKFTFLVIDFNNKQIEQ
ncbi:hypothetical protein [Candidatus Bandiella euplotis]|uniref:hypothetical protein n=1 Tax=Candidatus Bandiella euplotis TaxID=1664265 RepID=UPI002B2623E4|nr:hypothetical protein [Candidatus Bandiella woodruffii]